MPIPSEYGHEKKKRAMEHWIFHQAVSLNSLAPISLVTINTHNSSLGVYLKEFKVTLNTNDSIDLKRRKIRTWLIITFRVLSLPVHDGCLTRGRNCLPFTNTWIHPVFWLDPRRSSF